MLYIVYSRAEESMFAIYTECNVYGIRPVSVNGKSLNYFRGRKLLLIKCAYRYKGNSMSRISRSHIIAIYRHIDISWCPYFKNALIGSSNAHTINSTTKRF